jgi:hypothetical protein
VTRSLVLLVALALGCATPFAAVPTPSSFVELGKTRFDFQALSADGAVLVGRVVKPTKPATLKFWSEVVREELVKSRGYQVALEEKVRASDGEGTRFVCVAMREGTEYLYLLFLFVRSDGGVLTLEAGGKKAVVERHRPELDAYVAALSVR